MAYLQFIVILTIATTIVILSGGTTLTQAKAHPSKGGDFLAAGRRIGAKCYWSSVCDTEGANLCFRGLHVEKTDKCGDGACCDEGVKAYCCPQKVDVKPDVGEEAS